MSKKHVAINGEVEFAMVGARAIIKVNFAENIAKGTRLDTSIVVADSYLPNSNTRCIETKNTLYLVS